MHGPRSWLDLGVMAAALFAGPMIARWFGWPRWLAWPSAVVLVGGLLATIGFGLHVTFVQLAVAGAGFLWGIVVCAAAAIGFPFRQWRAPVSMERRALLGVAMVAPAGVLGYGTFIGRREFGLKEVDVPMPGLPADLDGLRLVQLSDIHLSPFLSRADVAYCVDLANETKAHVAFVTGDLITGIRDSIDDCLSELRRLKSDAGVFGCNGNHENYIEAEAYATERAAALGMSILRGDRRELRFGSATLNVAGVDHQWRGETYLPGAGAMVRTGQVNLLLSHNPDVFRVAKAQGWDLTLAGHMHGGQLNVEVAGTEFNAARMVTPYVYGLYREERSAIYVTRGIGTIGIPVRVGAPPEVALLKLRRV